MSWLRSRISPASSTPNDSRNALLDELVTHHHDFVWRWLRGFGLSQTDADDATQQVFMIAARKLDSIDPDRARSFLYGTARRVANNARRAIRLRREVSDEDIERAEPAEPAEYGPEQQAELLQARSLLYELLRELPEELRRVVVLAELEQLEVQAIAALESIPVGTAASRLRRGRQQFHALLAAAQHKNPFAQ